MEREHYESDIKGVIDAKEVVIGEGVVVQAGVYITGKGGPAERVVLGDFCFIGRDSQIRVSEFSLGDYSKLNEHAFAHGAKLQIGRNCWIGGYVTLDSLGGLDIDDNVGIGASSQIWTHVQFGDIVEGSRFYERNYMHIQRDAWFVGHCLVSPVRVGEKSMALLGSTVTKDMLPNHIYGGSPAKDLSDKLGYQFEERTVDEKAQKLEELIYEFETDHPEHRGKLVVVKKPEDIGLGPTFFDVSNRTYTKTRNAAEVAFLKKYVPLIKFYPLGEPSFVTPQQTVEPFVTKEDEI